MTEETTGPGPEAALAASWVGFELDDADGTPSGRVHGVYVDADGGEATWLVVALGRRGPFWRRGAASLIAVPARECAGGAGRVWTAQRQGELRGAPTVDPARPLLREHELAICAHFGIAETVGRAAEVAGRPEGAVTARPA